MTHICVYTGFVSLIAKEACVSSINKASYKKAGV